MKNKSKRTLLVLALLLAFAVVGPYGQQQETKYEAQLISFEDLEYPGIARETRIQGIVVVRAELDERGTVIKASALSSGAKLLIEASVSNVKKWKFKPDSGKYALVVYQFELADGACHDASHSLFRLIHPNFATITACSPVLK
jgi:TonB family protein